ncbi:MULTISPECIES: MFS transporter [Metallosphaera]|uniref:MFS transporter n=1 Tax=Metallosphaera TaxID=41980 RepID=UPI001F06A469|nr:MFS transporter [Metallosphaera sedula]MCH1772173.1 sugar porter family MFS transporter [Metallosphaera sedula]MCP6727719.1 sugar porter family MFS transporter [Metallosphaera sedula]
MVIRSNPDKDSEGVKKTHNPFDALDNIRSNRKIFFILLVAGIGAFADYYNTAGILTPSSLSYLKYFSVTTSVYGQFVFFLNIGILIGAITWGPLVDLLGRARMFFVDLVVMLVFATLSIFATNFHEFELFRILTGFAIGGDYGAALPFLSEFAPKAIRGRILALFWVLAQSGLVVGTLVSYYFLSISSISPEIWKIIFVTGLIPIIIGAGLRFTVPESARWLLFKGKTDKAVEAVKKVTGSSPQETVNNITSSFNIRKNIPLLLLLIVPTFIGIYATAMPAGLSTYFFPYITQSLGLSKLTSVLLQVPVVWVSEIVFTLILALITDKIGRLNSLIIGGTVLIISTLLIIPLTHNVDALLPLIFISNGSSVFSQTIIINWGAELYPTNMRGIASGINIMAFRLSLASTGFIEPVLLSLGGVPALYAFLGLLSLVGVMIVMILVGKRGSVEGKSLEEITDRFR